MLVLWGKSCIGKVLSGLGDHFGYGPSLAGPDFSLVQLGQLHGACGPLIVDCGPCMGLKGSD